MRVRLSAPSEFAPASQAPGWQMQPCCTDLPSQAASARLARKSWPARAGYSVQDSSVVVDLARHLDNYTSLGGGLAQIGAGIRLGPLYYAAWQDGQQAFPGGTCPAVGAGGHFLGALSGCW